MKRKDSPIPIQREAFSKGGDEEMPERAEGVNAVEAEGRDEPAAVYLLEEGALKPFSVKDYTTSTLYEVTESYSVECRLVRPEDPGNLIFEGKKPSKKTVPILRMKNGESVLLDSWESLEAKPEQLAEALEVIGAVPVKLAFVLRRK